MSKPYTVADMLSGVPGTGGIKSAIARNIGCSRATLDKHIAKSPTLAQAIADEEARFLDLAESVMYENVRLAAELQKLTKKPVDLSDVKWLLARKRRNQFGENVDVTSKGEPVVWKVVYDGSGAREGDD